MFHVKKGHEIHARNANIPTKKICYAYDVQYVSSFRCSKKEKQKIYATSICNLPYSARHIASEMS